MNPTDEFDKLKEAVAAMPFATDIATTHAEAQDWLRAQLAASEAALRAREQMEQCFRSGTDKEWAASAKLHSSTAKLPPISAEDRRKLADSNQRIAAKLRCDVEMFRTLLLYAPKAMVS